MARKKTMKEVIPLKPETDADMLHDLSRLFESFLRMGGNYNKAKEVRESRVHWMTHREKWENV